MKEAQFLPPSKLSASLSQNTKSPKSKSKTPIPNPCFGEERRRISPPFVAGSSSGSTARLCRRYRAASSAVAAAPTLSLLLPF